MKKMYFRFVICGVLAILAISCTHDFNFQPPIEEEELKVANTFDFNTTQKVELSVDFSKAGAYGAVYFDVYAENPIIETTIDDITTVSLDATIKPIYGGYTNRHGEFSQKVTLPAYVKHLYIVSENMLLDTNVLEADIRYGAAKADASKATRAAGATRAAVTRGAATNVIPENLYSWAYKGTDATTQDGKKAEYRSIVSGNGGWYAPLGTWDDVSGRPNYLLDRNNPANSHLVFNNTELEGLFELIGNAVSINRTCPEELRMPGDLTLQRSSEVAINMLGGTTMWRSTLGYYYYQGAAPADLSTLSKTSGPARVTMI